MKAKKTAIIFIILISALLLFSGCGHRRKTQINVGVSDNTMNWSFRSGKTGLFYGMEIDALNYYFPGQCRDLEFKPVPVSIDTREQLLLNGEIDCILSLFSATEKAEEMFDLSAPYYSSPTVLMVECGSLFKNIADLSGKRIGVISEDSVPAGQLLRRFHELRLTEPVLVSGSYDRLSDLLEEGQIEAICLEEAIASSYCSKYREIIRCDLGMQKYSMAFRKNDPLVKDVLEAANALPASPEFSHNLESWGITEHEQ